MVTSTPRQHLCQTTDIVTGWINGFHFWDATGKTLQSLPALQSNGNDTVRVDNVLYPWRKTTDLPTAIGDIRSCTSGDTPWASYDHNNAGMMAKSIRLGIPEGYEKAMKLAGFILPPQVRQDDHSILSPEPVWMTHSRQNSNVSYLFCLLV
jgi:hypothetical protein